MTDRAAMFDAPDDDASGKAKSVWTFWKDDFVVEKAQVAFVTVVAFAICVFLPAIGLNSQIAWCDKQLHTSKVDHKSCSCNCWDGQFKGCYSRNSASGNDYRHVYFNLTPETLQLFGMTVIFFYLAVTTLQKIFTLVLFRRSSVCWPALIALAASSYPHFYGYWAYFNYINDGWTHLRITQLWFSVTEIVASISIFFLCDKEQKLRPGVTAVLLWIPLTISVTHLSISWINYAASLSMNLLNRILRDTMLLSTDLITLIACVVMLRQLYSTYRSENWKSLAKFAVAGYVGLLVWFFFVIDASF